MKIESILGSRYERNNYIIFSRDLLKDIRPIQHNIEIYSQFQNYIIDCEFIADFTDSNRKKIAILSIKIAEDSNARTIQRNFVAKLLSNGELQ